jgi:hypothetical protein
MFDQIEKRMPINIFLSRPTVISNKFEAQYTAFEAYLARKGYKVGRLGANQYTMDSPLKGVMGLMKTCSGAIILGYPQYEVTAALSKAATPEQRISAVFPTPWNQIEATLAFKQRIPVLVVAHEGVTGGIFDHGVTGEYVHTTNLNRKDWHKTKAFQGVFQDWEKRIK